MLKLVLGRAGSGKTEYVFSSIKNLVEQGVDNILLITPEQFSFVSERRLLKDLGESRVNCVENGSFSRLASDISSVYGGDDLPVLSKGAKAVVFKKACEIVQDDLKLFSKNVTNNAFINSAIKIYDEMKSCRVTALDIMEASQNASRELLSQKLYDISLIMSTYDALIDGKFYDSANELTRLYNRLIDLDYFKDRIVFIDGFNGFVAQEYKIIEVILKQAKEVYITFCSDSYMLGDKYDLFSYVNQNISILQDVAAKANVPMAEPFILDKCHRFENDELKNIEKYAYSNIIKKQELVPSSVDIYAAKGMIDECDHTAMEISKLLRQGYKASDIAVICRDLDKYQRELQFSFDKFNVPYFNDERQNIASQPLIMFVNFLLRICAYSFRSDDIFSMLKTGLTGLDNENICNLENYAFLWNINGSKWKKDFTQSTKGFVEEITDSDQKAIDELNVSRDYVISRLDRFNQKTKKKNPADISKAIYYLLLDFSVDKGITNLARALNDDGKSALANEQGRVWDLLMNILDKLASVGGDEIVTIKEYSKLFNLMISNEDLGSIPTGLDNVQIGSADRIRCDNPRAVFVLGANEGEFPQNVSSAGLLSEADRISLIDNNFKLYSYGETLNAQEKYFAYMAISSAREKLFVSYRASSNDATESSIVTTIKSIYPNIAVSRFVDKKNIDTIETDANAFEILASNFENNSKYIATLKQYFSDKPEYKNRLEAICRLVENKDITINDKELSKNLFGKDMYLSASRIEDYYNCAFRYFCKFGIKAKPRTKAEMDPMQTGTVIHFVLEMLIKEVGSKALCNLDDIELKRLVDKYLNLFLETKMGDTSQFTARFKYQFLRLSKMLFSVVERLREEFKYTDFEAKAFELTIGDGSNGEDVKSQVINLEDGGSIQIRGAIDRVDTFEKNGTQYVRVVDYKSGTKEFQLSDIIYGLNLQMFIYLFTLCRSDSELAGTEAGVLYMHSARNVYNLERNHTQGDLDSENKLSFKMKGVVLNDKNHAIAQHMDREFTEQFVPVKCKNDCVTGNIVTLEDLGRISRKINSLVEEMGVNLHSGVINPNPVNAKHHDKTCEFCDYADVCMNRKEIIKRELEEASFDDVLNMLKEDDANA